MDRIAQGRYAKALFELSLEGGSLALDYEKMNLVKDSLVNDPEFMAILTNPQVSKEETKELLHNVYGRMLEGSLINFLYALVDAGRIDDIVGTIEEYSKLANEERNIMPMTVYSAVPLNETEKKQIKDKMSKRFNKELILENKVDKSLIGGVLIKVGDQVIDGTIKGRLTKIEAALSGITLQEIGVKHRES